MFDSKNSIYLGKTENCKTYAHTKHSIKRHLKNCNEITKIERSTSRINLQKCEKRFLKKFNQDRHVKQFHGDEIIDGRTMNFTDIDLTVAEMQPDEERLTMVQIIHPELPEEQSLTVAQGMSPIPPDEQPTTVVQQISPVRPASPGPP